MASGNRKTTMAKLNRERRLRERRIDKQARKDARKQMSPDHEGQPSDADGQSSPAGLDGDTALVSVEPRIDL